MKKILFILIFFMGILGESSAQMNLFKGSFEEALKKAREEKKSLFVDFYIPVFMLYSCLSFFVLASCLWLTAYAPRVENQAFFQKNFCCGRIFITISLFLFYLQLKSQ